MNSKVFAIIPFYLSKNFLVGNLEIKMIAHKTGNGVLVFYPFGYWLWATAGHIPPVSEYWRTTQEGTWAWVIDNPNQVHIMLYQGEDVVGTVADFKRHQLGTSVYPTGYWILKEGKTEDRGIYDGVSIRYENF